MEKQILLTKMNNLVALFYFLIYFLINVRNNPDTVVEDQKKALSGTFCTFDFWFVWCLGYTIELYFLVNDVMILGRKTIDS